MFIPKDQENYEVVTGLKVTIAVAKANPSYTLPTGVTATYGQTLAEVKLPEGWSFVDETESVGVVGDNEFDAIYTPSDTQNYNRVTGLKVTVKVEKAIPPYTLPTNLTATYGQTLADVKLPKGWKFTSVLTTPVGNVGDNEFAVVFTPDDTDNYEIVIGLKVIIKVGKAIPPYTLPENVTAIYGQTLGDITLGEGWTFADNAETPVGNVGTHEFEVIFTPEDTENYDTVTGLKVTITVSQAPSQFPELEEMHIAYDPTATVGSIKLPKVDKQGNALEGTLTFAEDEDQSAIIGGAVTNHYKVVYTPNDANYAPVEGTFTVIIGKAEQQPIDLSLVPERIDMEVTKQFTISIANEAELKGDKTFISSDSSILDIDEDGNVQVVGRGKVTITVIISGNANYQPVSATKEIIVVSGTKPTISLNGKEEVIVEVGNTYTDAGVIAYNNLGEDITNRVQTDNPVNTTVVGTYTITYNVTDASGNVADEVTRTVRVVDTQKPVITLEGQPEVIVEVGDTYTDAGAIANDNYDGVITEKIITVNPVDTTVVGTYTITYNVTDANGNKADEVTRTVRVVDTQKPVIKIDTLFQRLEAGSKYQRVEAQVTDNYDKNIEVTVDTSKLNMNKLGLYDVIYNAVDSSGNAAEPVTVKVQIIDTTAPTIEFANPADATQVYVRGGKYKVPQFITTDNAGNEDVTIVKSGIVDSSTPGKYTVEYYAVDKTGNKSEKLVVNVTVQNYPPIISYVRNDAINPIVEGEDYAYSLTVHFEGTGTLTTAEGTRTITSGETLSDGEYSLTATLPDGASSTVNFVINRMGPKVNLSNGVYLEAQTIIVEKPEIIVRATLRDAQGKLISDDINVINGYTLNEKGVNTYSLVLEDSKGRTTILDSIIVYIAE